MTLLPSHDAIDRPDLPEYPLGPYCSVPGCTELRESGGGHHIYRRSNQTKSWWVQLSDGALIPNRVGLCFQHHRDVTGDLGGHKARITIEDRVNLIWENDPDDADGSWWVCGALKFAHDPYEVLHLTQLTMGGEVPHETVVAPNGTVPDGPTPGQPCPTCHRRVNHPKKQDSPKSKTVAYRVPLDDAETHHEMLDAWADHWGLLESKHHLYKLVTFAAADALAGPKKKLGKLKDA